MSIRYLPNKRYMDRGERVDYPGLQLLAAGTAIVEPETIGVNEWVNDDVVAIAAAVDTAVSDSFVTLTSETINAGLSLIFTDAPLAPAGSTVDSVVSVTNNHDHLYFSGFISEPFGPGNGAFVNFVAHNPSLTNVSFGMGATIFYSVHTGIKQAQANTPNAQLIVTAAIDWLGPFEHDQPVGMGIDPLNLTAVPTITIPAHSITPVEINSAAVIKLAANYTGLRAIHTVSGNHAVARGPAVTLGTQAMTGAVTGQNVRVGQIASIPSILFTAYVSGADTVTVQARNIYFQSVTVHDGLQLKVFAY